MNISSFEGATVALLTEEPEVNTFTRKFAEGVTERLAPARFDRAFVKEVGRAATARDHMRLFTHLLLLDKEALVLAFLKGKITKKALLDAYAKRVSSYVDIYPDGALGVGAYDLREVDFAARTFVRFQAHDARSGSFEEAVQNFGVKGIFSSLWGEIADDIHHRKEAARKAVAAMVAPPARRLRFYGSGKVRLGETPIMECDDRFSFDDKGGVFLVADGAGPTYGGYYVPIAMDAALRAIKQVTVGSSGASAEARLREGMKAAGALLDEDRRVYEQALGEALAKGGGDRRKAALATGIEHARARFGRSIDSFVHHGMSVTAIHVDQREVAIAQIGSCRAYRVRAGSVELLMPDHLLATVSGDPMLAEAHPDVCTRMLGMGSSEVEYRTSDVKSGDVFVLLGMGVWSALSPDEILGAVSGGAASMVVEGLMNRVPRSVRGSGAVAAVFVYEGTG